MSEKADFITLRKNLAKPQDRLDRVENICGEGMPDVSYCIEGVDGWIEMKSPIEGTRKPTSKLFTGRNHKLRQSQKNWFLKQKNAGGKGYILICTDKRWMLIDGCHDADRVNDMTVGELMEIKLWYALKGPFTKTDWSILRHKLIGDM